MKSKNKDQGKSLFSYIILAAVLIIPFMYSFFYLKAYWNPYGKGNIDNLPVAIVNEDKGERGKQLISSLEEKNTLKLSIVSSDEATDGLYNKDYYAVITIPEDFTSSIESVGTENKKHPTITYSPNQKSNYLASQIIDKVMTTVEKSLDNQINSEVVNTLADKLNQVPSSLETISDGFEELENGTTKLQSGSNDLATGLNTLNTNYNDFSNGLSTIKSGSDTLTASISSLNDGINTLATNTAALTTLKDNIPTLTGSVSYLNSSMATYNTNSTTYVDNVNNTLTFSENAAKMLVNIYEQNNLPQDELYLTAKKLLESNSFTALKTSGTTLKGYSSQISSGLNELNTKTSALSTLPEQIDALQSGISTLQSGSKQINQGMQSLNSGLNNLTTANSKISAGINTLNQGSITLNNGLGTLNTSVKNAREELQSKIISTKSELKSLEGMKEYTQEPVNIETKAVNEVSSYGTAFSPFFISIALWVGALMMYIVLYYDKENRFSKLSIDSDKHLQRTLCYHGLATLSAIILGILLSTLLDFQITNYFLYYISIILIANTFIAIIEFLIVNLKDIGKFIALILFVLQLAAAGGTFPIETVTKGFRFLHPILPMTYTIDLLREALVTIESSLLTKNLIIVICIFIVFTAFNVIKDICHDKKTK